MKIDILCNDGSPIGVTYQTMMGDDPEQIGVGGAELALLTMCEEWTKLGHTVTLYNNPRVYNASPFEQLNINSFYPHDKRDVLIVFRSPNHKIAGANGLKVWWSCDQFTVGDFRQFSGYVDKIVTISPFHTKYFEDTYGIKNTIPIDLPVRINDYDGIEIEKVPNRIIFTSIPHSGLHLLFDMWGDIRKEIPDAALVITSDYRLWGNYSPGVDEYRYLGVMNAKNGVIYLGAIPRRQLVKEELSAQLFVYPAIYEELFCIACSEAMYASAYPITSSTGALETTNMGTVIPKDAGDLYQQFINEIVYLLTNKDELKLRQQQVHELALQRFAPSVILKQWDEKVFKHG